MPPRNHRREPPPQAQAPPPSTPRAEEAGAPRRAGWAELWPTLLIAGLATLAVLITMGPDTGGLGLPGPGLTIDEYYDADAGKLLVTAWRTQGLDFFRAENIERNFGHLTLHPPLGRWIIGWVHHLFDVRPELADSIWMPGARVAPTLGFGALVLTVGLATGRRAGRLAGAAGALSVALMPRMFAHAHFATLDTLTALFFLWALVALAVALDRGPRLGAFALAGVVWGLALSVKMLGAFLFPAAVGWTLYRLRGRGVLPLLVWTGVGCAVFFLLWPWLWWHPVERLREYFGSATHRLSIDVFYAGRVWNDRQVPWHYPWVIAAVTLPVGTLALGLWGLWARRRQWRVDALFGLAALGMLGVMLLFTLPGTPVYDGERLFLMVFPLFGMFVGLGVQALVEAPRWASWPAKARTAICFAVLAAQGAGLVAYHPFQLSYYNLLVGGLAGAERLGFEVTYWGDTLDAWMVDEAAQAAAEGEIWLAPSLAPFHAPVMEASFPALRRHGAHLVGFAGTPPAGPAPRYLLVYQRRSALGAVSPWMERGQLVAERRLRGVWLARLYRLP